MRRVLREGPPYGRLGDDVRTSVVGDEAGAGATATSKESVSPFEVLIVTGALLDPNVRVE